VKLTVVGCSPAWPNPGGAQSGYLIEGPGRLLLDCGPGILARLRKLEDGWPSLDAIVITHLHVDHWGDLVPWTIGCAFGPGQGASLPELWLPPGGGRELAALVGALGAEGLLEPTIPMAEYADGEVFPAAGVSVEPHALPHYDLVSYGMRVSDGRATLAYSSDCGPTGLLVDLARDADLFICEATLETGELDSEPRGHLSPDEAVALFGESGARRLLLTHHPAELPLAERLEQARDGLVLEL
jgi:ribonuclease BN (tRNA processing enzyme)